MRLLVSLVDDMGASLLFITHDFAVLAHATTHCYVLDEGRIVESGRTADVLASPRDERRGGWSGCPGTDIACRGCRG